MLCFLMKETELPSIEMQLPSTEMTMWDVPISPILVVILILNMQLSPT